MTAADGGTSFTLRYRLTLADARGAFWFAAREWVPVLVGIALLTLLGATWSPLGHAGRVAAIVFPVAAGLTVLSLLNRAMKSVEPYLGREFVLSFAPHGLRFESALANSEIPWTTMRAIVRGSAFWLFHVRNSGRFFVPAVAIPVEARAFVARWAGDAGVKLT